MLAPYIKDPKRAIGDDIDAWDLCFVAQFKYWTMTPSYSPVTHTLYRTRKLPNSYFLSPLCTSLVHKTFIRDLQCRQHVSRVRHFFSFSALDAQRKERQRTADDSWRHFQWYFYPVRGEDLFRWLARRLTSFPFYVTCRLLESSLCCLWREQNYDQSVGGWFGWFGRFGSWALVPAHGRQPPDPSA